MKTNYLQVLEKYFNGEMTPEEMSELEQNREKDPGLNDAFREYEQVLESLRDIETLELRRKLKELREQDMKSGRRSRFICDEKIDTVSVPVSK